MRHLVGAKRVYRLLARWRAAPSFGNWATLFLVVCGPVLAVLTFLILRGGSLDGGGDSTALRFVLMADLAYVLMLASLVFNRVAHLIAARRARSAGAQLHLRLSGVFAALALSPAILVAFFAFLSINQGFEGWFSDRVGQVLDSSARAAQAYQEEHRRELERDARWLGAQLDGARSQNVILTDGDVRAFLESLQNRFEQGLSEAYVIDGTGQIVSRGQFSFSFDYEMPSLADFETVDGQGIAIIEDRVNNEFRALLPLQRYLNRYLYVTRDVDGEILSLLDDTRETVGRYQQLESERGALLLEFGLFYLGFALILILAAIWFGLWFAEQISRPVGRLVSASQRVGRGDLNVRVREEEGQDEIALLGRNFNQMTSQLKEQRDRLLENTQQIEGRRRLFDSVLSSITSGVVGLDPEGRVTFANRSAARLLDLNAAPDQAALALAVPEFAEMFNTLVRERRDVLQEQVRLTRAQTQETLLVQMAPRRNETGALEGYVVAFDDITDLVSAQRTAAWGDVARRIAHEIKNPLTPIQLSAERIRRKFSKEVKTPEDMQNLTDVIVRQTNDLRRIVDEFSQFARMPEPKRQMEDLNELVVQAVTLQEAGQPEVTFDLTDLEGPLMAELDATMIGQAFTNLLKNAGEAIESFEKKHGMPVENPTVRVTVEHTPGTARVVIEDNGVGLPKDRALLFEPYVTTRDQGTGLGLPIVKKIIEEHGGSLLLEDAEPFVTGAHRGARVTIELPTVAVMAAAGE